MFTGQPMNIYTNNYQQFPADLLSIDGDINSKKHLNRVAYLVISISENFTTPIR
jgi:hypothetical protein